MLVMHAAVASCTGKRYMYVAHQGGAVCCDTFVSQSVMDVGQW